MIHLSYKTDFYDTTRSVDLAARCKNVLFANVRCQKDFYFSGLDFKLNNYWYDQILLLNFL
jgi:hypothetical protein